MTDINSLSHSKWRCQYHIVFAPKYRRKEIYTTAINPIGNMDFLSFFALIMIMGVAISRAMTLPLIHHAILNKSVLKIINLIKNKKQMQKRLHTYQVSFIIGRISIVPAITPKFKTFVCSITEIAYGLITVLAIDPAAIPVRKASVYKYCSSP